MKLSPKQKILVDYCLANGGITTAEANELLKHHYFHNSAHYVAEILTRLVKCGAFKRVSRGKYEIGAGRVKAGAVIEHPKLF